MLQAENLLATRKRTGRQKWKLGNIREQLADRVDDSKCTYFLAMEFMKSLSSREHLVPQQNRPASIDLANPRSGCVRIPACRVQLLRLHSPTPMQERARMSFSHFVGAASKRDDREGNSERETQLAAPAPEVTVLSFPTLPEGHSSAFSFHSSKFILCTVKPIGQNASKLWHQPRRSPFPIPPHPIPATLRYDTQSLDPPISPTRDFEGLTPNSAPDSGFIDVFSFNFVLVCPERGDIKPRTHVLERVAEPIFGELPNRRFWLVCFLQGLEVRVFDDEIQ